MPNLPMTRPSLPRPVRLRTTRATAEPEAERAVPRGEIAAAGLRWISIERPTQADGEWLQATFDFHALDMEDVFSRNQRAKLDVYDEYLFLVIQFPVYEKARRRLISAELDVFIGPDYLITLPNHPIPPVEALFERLSERDDLREAAFARGSGYLLYRIVDACVDASFPMLRKMGLKLDQLEDDIFEQERSSEIVRELNDIKQEIIAFRRIVRPQRTVFRDLERTKSRYLHIEDEIEVYFDDISDAAARIWDLLENYKEVIDSLEATNESVLSHRLNDSIRILTGFSVMLLPLTLTASIWGMNVPVPGQEQALAFPVLLLLMAGGLGLLIVLFRKRGWL